MVDQELLKVVDGFIATTGIKITEIGDGFAKGEIDIKKEHLNPIKTVHGGVIFTLADTIGGLAAVGKGERCTTVSSDIVYLNPTLKSKKLFAFSQEIKRGRRISYIDTVITDDLETKIAKSTTVYYHLGSDGKAV